jgi:leader peptidase (prepilin peptidase)/N-methyltransferase
MSTIIDSFIFFFNQYEGFLPIAFMFIFGSIIGSFLNVLIYRIPLSLNIDFINDIKRNKIETTKEMDVFYDKNKNLSLLTPSKCPCCNQKIKPWFNIPLLGFFLTRGKCSICKNKISYQYPLIEFINAVGYLAILIISNNMGLNELLLMISFSILLAISIIDIKEHIIPDVLVFPFLFIGLFLSENENIIIDVSLMSLFLYSFVYIYKYIRKIDFIMGFGDVKLFIACSAWIGLSTSLYLIVLSCFIGILVALVNKKTAIPFGPSIVFSLLIIFLYNY